VRAIREAKCLRRRLGDEDERLRWLILSRSISEPRIERRLASGDSGIPQEVAPRYWEKSAMYCRAWVSTPRRRHCVELNDDAVAVASERGFGPLSSAGLDLVYDQQQRLPEDGVGQDRTVPSSW